MHWKEFRSHLSHLSSADQARVEKAFHMAQKAHEGQKRRSGEPYFTHPLAVAGILAALHADTETIIAALLHDAIEDTPVTLEDIDKAFNGNVRTLIDGVTKLSKADIGEKPTLDEQIETLRKMFTLMEQDIRIMVIKLVDRLHNMQTAEFLPPARQKTLAEETMDVYVKIADRLSMQDIRDELEALCLAILDPENFTALQKLRMDSEGSAKKIAQKIQRIMGEEKFPEDSARILVEPIRWQRIADQREAGQAAVTGAAAYVLAIVVHDIDDCYRVLGVLHQRWQREILSFQDFINSPTINGYRGLHTTIILEDGTRIRCKIRTSEMQEYAHTGIATYAFRNHHPGTIQTLPWVQRISPLSEDTVERSQAFWESLKSDILGESIVVHGPADETLLIPQGSTVLDAAFYLLQDKATRVSAIRMNGKEVPFYTPLENAASIDSTLEAHPTVQRQWMEWVQTGLAIARIRSALGKQSSKSKVAIGKQLLQDVFTERKRGFLEEFDEAGMRSALLAIGYADLREACIAIADGRLEPGEVFQALFENPGKAARGGTAVHSVRIAFPLGNVETISALVRVYQRYRPMYRKIRMWYNPLSGMCTVRSDVELASEQLRAFLAEMEGAGAAIMHADGAPVSGLRFAFGIIFLLLLWGFDPVMARLLLQRHDVSAIDLTIVRFWSLAAISGVLLLRHRWKSSLSEARLTLGNATLWLSIILLLSVSLTTYLSLQYTSPLHYTIPMTAAGLLLTSIVNRKKIGTLVLTWMLLCTGIALLVLQTPWSIRGILLTLSAVGSFTAFTVVSERYKRTEHVGARAAQYFFILSMVCALLTIPLFPFHTLQSYDAATLAEMIAFSVGFAGLPYYMYYYLLSHKQIDVILRYSFVIIFTTGLGQALWPESGAISPVMLAAMLLVTLGAILPLFGQKKKDISAV